MSGNGDADFRRLIRGNPRRDPRQSASPGERGAVLTMVVVAALISAIGAYALLTMARNQAMQAGFDIKRAQSRYAAEGGLVYAQQRLLADPAFCGGPTTVGAGANAVSVAVVVTSCGAGSTHTLTATVNY